MNGNDAALRDRAIAVGERIGAINQQLLNPDLTPEARAALEQQIKARQADLIGSVRKLHGLPPF